MLYTFIVSSGLAVPWKMAGKPPENITKIIGINFSLGKLYVLTDTGLKYSTNFGSPGNVIHYPIQWIRENDSNVVTYPIDESNANFKSPPPPFKVKQLFQFQYPTIEGTSEEKFALSEDGYLWYWSFGQGVFQGLFYALIVTIEIVAYLLALLIRFVLFLVKGK